MADWMEQVDESWTLFLDRDGVINERLPGDYVKNVSEFVFLPGAELAIRALTMAFGRTVVVTNQQGIGKGIMTAEDLVAVHEYMLHHVSEAGGVIDRVYLCPELAGDNPKCRKPNTGMAEQAKRDFPEIDFQRAVMVGDSPSDMEFGDRMQMKTVFIGQRDEGLCFESLAQFADQLFV